MTPPKTPQDGQEGQEKVERGGREGGAHPSALHASEAAVSLEAQLACAERELRLRLRVYPRLVREDRMREAQAAHEIAAMLAIVETLGALAAERAGQLRLDLGATPR